MYNSLSTHTLLGQLLPFHDRLNASNLWPRQPYLPSFTYVILTPQKTPHRPTIPLFHAQLQLGYFLMGIWPSLQPQPQEDPAWCGIDRNESGAVHFPINDNLMTFRGCKFFWGLWREEGVRGHDINKKNNDFLKSWRCNKWMSIFLDLTNDSRSGHTSPSLTSVLSVVYMPHTTLPYTPSLSLSFPTQRLIFTDKTILWF